MEQKRKVKSLIPMSESGELGIFSRFLIVLSCIFCFGTLLMLALCVSYVDAASINSRSYVYSGGIDENAETLYELGFTETDNLRDVKTKIYMKSNSVGKNNLYMEPYPIVVQKGLLGGSIGSIGGLYLNFLGGDSLDISSANVSIIGGNKLTVNSSNSNATIFGGENNTIKGSTSSSPRVIVGGMKNTIGGANGVILGGEENNLDGGTSSILGGRSNSIEEPSTNAIVAGNQVETNLKNIFAFSSNGGKFKPNNENAFYLDVQKGLGLKMNTTGGVASSGAVSFGSVKGIGTCAGDNIGLIGLSGNCLYGCSNAGWQELGCFEQEWLTGNNFSGYCVGPVNDDVAKEKNRYARCHDGREEMYANVAFETKLWTGESCPDLGVPGNPCVYRCADGYHYYNDPSGEDSGCKKDCLLPWDNGSGVKHKTIITGYSLTGVVCEEKEKALGCEGKKAIMQCNDGKWVGIGNYETTKIYSDDSDDIKKIIYQYSGCTTFGNKCNTGVYQYTNTGILNWVNLGNCTNHIVDYNLCVITNTVYSGRCYRNHTLVSLEGGPCITGSNTKGCRCKPNQRTGDCLKTSFPDSHATAIKTGFIQTATGDNDKWDPSSKSYVPYSGSKPDAECTFKCDEGYSAYRNKNKKKYECLLNCEYNGITYENGQTISGYATGSVTCPNLCKPKNLTCHNGEWTGGTTGCFTTDEICSGYNFTRVIDHAKCDPCTKYKGSLEGICTTGDMVYSCECHYNPKDGYYVLSGTECVPATTGADCKGDEPIGSGNLTFPLGKTFKQTWSGGAHKWLPEEIKYHYGTGECGFFCNSGSSYIVSGNKCEGNECVNHNFGVEGSYHFYTPSSNGIVGKTNSVLYESGAEAQKAYGNGEKCIYFCNKCYDKKSGGLLGLGSPKCEPKTFTGTFWCKNNGNTGWLQAVAGKTQTFTYNVPTDVNGKCSDRTGYTFIGWSTNSGATSPMFTYGDKLTGGNYNSCSSTNFFAVYKCAQGYTGNGINCKKNSYVCTGTAPEYAELVPGSATGGLEESIEYKLYRTKEAASGKACAYVCDSEHHYYESGGVARCKICKKALSSDQTICVDDVKCTDPAFPTKYYDTKEKKMKCTWKASCKGNIPANAKEPEDYLYEGEQSDFGGIAWYCGKDYGKGCYFKCDEGYECSIKYSGGYFYINNEYFYYSTYSYGNIWLPVTKFKLQKGSKKSAQITTGTTCINKNACSPYKDVGVNFEGYVLYTGVQLYGGTKEWTFITSPYGHNGVLERMNSNNDDCLIACTDGSMYVTGATYDTYQSNDNDTKFCWTHCDLSDNEYYNEYGVCEECPHQMKADTSLMLPIEYGNNGNAVRCVEACKDYEQYNPSTDDCDPLCEGNYYYNSYWGSCYYCDSDHLTGWNGVVYTDCEEEERPQTKTCPPYHKLSGDECVVPHCKDEGKYLSYGGYCYSCNTKLTDYDSSLDEYLDCLSCGNGKHWDESKKECVYDQCNSTCEKPGDPCKYYKNGYGCTSCPSGQKPGGSKSSSYGNNYIKCVNICADGWTYRNQINPNTNTYCWKSVDAGCPDGSDPIKDADGNYYCQVDE